LKHRPHAFRHTAFTHAWHANRQSQYLRIGPSHADVASAPVASLEALENSQEFIPRHIGPDAEEQQKMLAAIGKPSLDALIRDVMPDSIARARPMDLPPPVTEAAALAELKAIASKNQVLKSFIGQGYYGTHTPGVILRNILENPPGTRPTPLPGRDLTRPHGGAGQLPDHGDRPDRHADCQCLHAGRGHGSRRGHDAGQALCQIQSHRIVLAGDLHPQTIEVIETRARPIGIEVVIANSQQEWEAALAARPVCSRHPVPASSGWIVDWKADVQAIHAKQAAAIVATDLLALTLLTPPGEWDADIVVGNSQRFGMPMGAGGPHAAFMACRDEYKRSLPGRLVGVSVDAHGKPAYRLALQTREQHIRREKATSNICTAQVLPAVIASMYAVYHGPQGLKRIAQRVARLTAILSRGLARLGFSAHHHDTAFDTLCLHTRDATDALAARAVPEVSTCARHGMNICASAWTKPPPAPMSSCSGASLPRRARPAHHRGHGRRPDLADPRIPAAQHGLPDPPGLQHPPQRNRDAALPPQPGDKDLALDRSMIPLGSCTMKLNATSEMIPITWPEFAEHPPVRPADQLQGYAELTSCCAVAVPGHRLRRHQPAAQCRQPGRVRRPAGHQGLPPRGEAHRNICLIPAAPTAPTRPARRWWACRWWSPSATTTATSTWPT
jgi:glycine dehydrogenase